jgi:hypothetical protein
MKRIAMFATLLAVILSLHSCAMAEGLAKAASRTVSSAGGALGH